MAFVADTKGHIEARGVGVLGRSPGHAQQVDEAIAVGKSIDAGAVHRSSHVRLQDRRRRGLGQCHLHTVTTPSLHQKRDAARKGQNKEENQSQRHPTIDALRALAALRLLLCQSPPQRMRRALYRVAGEVPRVTNKWRGTRRPLKVCMF